MTPARAAWGAQAFYANCDETIGLRHRARSLALHFWRGFCYNGGRMSCIRIMGLAVVLGVCGAVSSRADLIPPSELPATTLEQCFDNFRDGLDDQYQGVARKLDSFFKRADDLESTNHSTARVRLMLKVQDGETPSPNAAFSGKLALPYAQERLNLFVDNIKRGALPGDENPTLEDNAMQVGAQLSLWDSFRSYLHLQGGIRFHGIPDPFTQLEFEYECKLDGWVGRFSQDVFYYAKERAGELTEVDVEHTFRDKSIFRSTTAANYTEDTAGMEFEQTLSLDMPLAGHCRNLIPSASVFAHKNGTFLMDNYRANITYRRCFYRPWLIFEITPQIEFPRERDYQFTPSIRFCLEVWFGSLPEDR